MQQITTAEETIHKMKSKQPNGAQTRATSTLISDDETKKKDIVTQLLKQ